MAVTPPLMSERNEPYASTWRDCMYAAGIMACYKHGYRAFPFGYGWQEREALERADDRPNEIGASVLDLDIATSRRYGFKLDPVPSGNLVAALRGPATTGLVVAGENRALATSLRKWSPSFIGSHAVYVQPMGDGAHVRWLDPMAPWGYAGDVIDYQVVVTWNNATAGKVNSCRFAKEPSAPPASTSLSHFPGGNVYRYPAGATTGPLVVGYGNAAAGDYHFVSVNLVGAQFPNPWYRFADSVHTQYNGYFVPRGVLT